MAVTPAERQVTAPASGIQTSASSPQQSFSPQAQAPLSRRRTVLNWLAVAAGVYFLITAVGVIGSGFSLATGDQAEALFGFAANPMIGLMIGIAATALTQSSSTTTSVTVGLVAGGLPLSIAIPIMLGANIGTTMTNTLVSLAMIRDKEQFRRGFSAATVHDFFNLLAVAIFLPLEMAFGLLERAATSVAGMIDGSEAADTGLFETLLGGVGAMIKGATAPTGELIGAAFSPLPDVWAGIAMIAFATAMILVVINMISRKLKAVLVGRAERILHASVGRNPIVAIGSGVVVTVMVQSSSTTTALMVPLAGSGKLSLRQIYPFTLGANIGTTITALIAAMAFDGHLGTIALTAALVHLFFNIFATALIFGVPGLREVPLIGARWLSELAVRRAPAAFAWVCAVFIALPLGLIFLL
ncbi:Na/Pi symporter [Nesterenkonia sp. NBAIMH1]|uniref:Na/Pi symporter n=1 Tax=Nesterenkonia sp. NBAIMH1 TaxID=2600320 RepID=UPI0011B3775E|nr:Na/Pi symporter [Nesterenkonia sp. NBAIMH1]